MKPLSLPLNTEVQWFSSGNCLAEFYSLFDTDLEFLQGCHPDLAKELVLARNDIADLSDIFAKLNKLNLSFQGDEVTLIKVKTKFPGFTNKLVLYQRNLARQDFFQCASLQKLETGDKGISDVDIDMYNENLLEFHKDMYVRVQDVFQLEIPQRIRDPSSEHGILDKKLVISS